MSIANTLILIYGTRHFTAKHFAHEYLREFQHGGRRKGYARNFQKFLENCQDASDFLLHIRGRSNKNGAAMRAVPFGVIKSLDTLLNVTSLQAALTHNTPEGLFSARAVALMSHFALYTDLPFSQLPKWCWSHGLPEDQELCQIMEQPWPNGRRIAQQKPGDTMAVLTVQAVAHVLQTRRNLLDIMSWVLRQGGDTDSVAAIAWGIASCRQQDWLPDFFWRDLEQGSLRTGEQRLRTLGRYLMETDCR